MPVTRLFSRSTIVSKLAHRSFVSSKPDVSKPNMLRVGLTLGCTVALWALLIKQHSSDVREYKARNGLE